VQTSWLRFTELESLSIEVLHCWNRDCLPFCFCILTLTFIYDLDLYSLELYRMCQCELPMSRLSKVIWHTYIHTDRHDWNYIQRRSVGGPKCNSQMPAWINMFSVIYRDPVIIIISIISIIINTVVLSQLWDTHMRRSYLLNSLESAVSHPVLWLVD